MVTEMVSQLKSFSADVIQDYIDGKGGIMPTTSSASPTTTGKEETPTLKEATRMAIIKAKKMFG
jgi:hypothetical protein